MTSFGKLNEGVSLVHYQCLTMPQKKTGLHTACLKLHKTALIQQNSINKKTKLIYMKKSLNWRQAELSSSITLEMA